MTGNTHESFHAHVRRQPALACSAGACNTYHKLRQRLRGECAAMSQSINPSLKTPRQKRITREPLTPSKLLPGKPCPASAMPTGPSAPRLLPRPQVCSNMQHSLGVLTCTCKTNRNAAASQQAPTHRWPWTVQWPPLRLRCDTAICNQQCVCCTQTPATQTEAQDASSTAGAAKLQSPRRHAGETTNMHACVRACMHACMQEVQLFPHQPSQAAALPQAQTSVEQTRCVECGGWKGAAKHLP